MQDYPFWIEIREVNFNKLGVRTKLFFAEK